MKRTRLVVLLFFILSRLEAQQTLFQLKKTLGEDYNDYTISHVRYQEDNNQVTLYGVNWEKGWLNEKKESEGGKKLEFIQGVGIRGEEVSQPILTVLTLDAQGTVTDKVEKPIHLSGVFDEIPADASYVINDYESLQKWIDSDETAQLDELRTEFPEAFPAEKEDYQTVELAPSYGGNLKKQITEHKYNRWSGNYKAEKQGWQTVSFEKATSKEYGSEEYFFDSEREQILFPLKAQLGDRLSPYFNKQIYLIDANGEVLNSTSIELEQPKDLKFVGGFGEGQTFSKGAILIYGRAQLGKKKNDQDLTRHYAVLLDESGSVKYQTEFSLGVDKQFIQFYTSFRQGDQFYVFGRLLGKDNSAHVVIKFDQNGFVETTKYNYRQMVDMLKGDSDPAMRLFISRGFAPYWTTSLPDGSTLIAGETFEEEKETLPPAEGQAFGEVIIHRYHLSRIFLVFDPTGKWVGYYSKRRPEEKSEKPASMELVFVSDSRVYLHDSAKRKMLALDLNKEMVEEIDSVEKTFSDKEGQAVLVNDWNATEEGRIVDIKVLAY